MKSRLAIKVSSAFLSRRSTTGGLPVDEPVKRTGASARFWLTLLVLSCILPAVVGAALLIAHDQASERAQAIDDAMDTARALTQAVDRELASVTASAWVLASAPSLKSDDLASFYAQAADVLREHPFARNVVLTDASGQQVLNTLVPFGRPLPRHGNLPLLEFTFKADHESVSDLFIGAVTRTPLIAIEVPVRRAGKVAYALSIGVFPDQLSAILTGQRLPAGRIGAIFDSTGTIVGSTRDPVRVLGRKAPPVLLDRMRKEQEGYVDMDSIEGIPIVSAFSRSAVSNWTVAIGIPRSQFAQHLQDSLWWAVITALGLLTVSLSLAWLVGGRIVQSIRGLIAPALALGDGKSIVVPPLMLREADQVREALQKASAILEENEARLQRLGDNLPSGAIYRTVVDASGKRRFDYISKGIERLTGVTAEQAIADPSLLDSRVDPADLAALRVAQHRSQSTGEPVHVDVRFRRSDGTLRWLNLHSAPERRADGSTVWDGVVTDVTERTLQTEELERSNLELQRFAYVAWHDLQSPLRSVSGFAQLLQSDYAGRLDARADDWIRRIVRSAERMAVLIKDLLTYSRVDSHSRPFEAVALGEAVDDALFLLDASIRESGAEISRAQLPVVRGDRAQLVQLVQNLVSNAITFRSAAAPRIQIAAQASGSEWVVSVRDNGIGIDRKYHQRIFEIFQRLHGQYDVPRTGIGLPVCRRIVQRHGGRLWVESEPGEGSTFYFTLAAPQQSNP